MGSSIKYVRKIFRKTNISNRLIRTRAYLYQGVRNVSFSENFAYVLNGCPQCSFVWIQSKKSNITVPIALPWFHGSPFPSVYILTLHWFAMLIRGVIITWGESLFNSLLWLGESHFSLVYYDWGSHNLEGAKIISYTKAPAGNYMFKVNNRNTRKKCEICSKLRIKTPEWRQWRRSGAFIVNFEDISHYALVFLLLTLNR